MIGYNRYDTKTINLIGNLIPILLFLFWFYKATNQAAKIIAASLAIVFITAFVLFMTIDNNVDSHPYWLQFIVAALISGAVLTITAYLKYEQSVGKKVTD